MRATCLPLLILVDLITLMIFDEANVSLMFIISGRVIPWVRRALKAGL
jgi:hypothetical protein